MRDHNCMITLVKRRYNSKLTAVGEHQLGRGITMTTVDILQDDQAHTGVIIKETENDNVDIKNSRLCK